MKKKKKAICGLCGVELMNEKVDKNIFLLCKDCWEEVKRWNNDL